MDVSSQGCTPSAMWGAKQPSMMLARDSLRFSGGILGRGAQGAVFDAVFNDQTPVAAKLNNRGSFLLPSRARRGSLSARQKTPREPECFWAHDEDRHLSQATTFSGGQTDSEQTLWHEASVLMLVHGHPNVIGMMGFIETVDFQALVLEKFGNGCTLFHHIQRVNHGRGLEDGSIRHIFGQLVSALRHMHSHRVCHNDLKLENILLDEDTLQVKIIDFGLSRILINPTGNEPPGRCGTRQYAAPELLRGCGFNGEAADVWSLGVCLFAMRCGKLPRAAGRQRWTSSGEAESGLQTLLCRMLSHNAADRPSLEDIDRDFVSIKDRLN